MSNTKKYSGCRAGKPANGSNSTYLSIGLEEDIFMRAMKFIAMVGAVALALSLGAFAKDMNSGKFDLEQSAKVGSTVLQPGQYKAEWTGSGDALNISIIKDGKTVATTHGTLKELPSKSPYTAVTVKTLPDNSTQVDEIDFNHRTQALVLSGM
jgi:hypothetical protein